MGRLKGRREFLKNTGMISAGILAKAVSDMLEAPIIHTAYAQGSPATFYVDAVAGDDSKSGLSPSTPWKTVEKVNASRFEPGTRIFFKRGQTFNDAPLIPQDGGLPGNPIIYGSFGSARFRPTIMQSMTLGNFSQVGSNVWVTNFDGVGEKNSPLKIARHLSARFIMRGRRSELSELTAFGDFWHDVDNHLLYVFSSDDPSGLIEAPQSSINGVIQRNWIVVEHLRFDLANDFCVTISASNLVLRNCTVSYAGEAGIQTPAGDLSNCQIEDNEVFECSGSGIQINSTHSRDNFSIRRNLVHHNCLDIVDGRFGALNYTGGIKVLCVGSGKNLVIEDNIVWANGNIRSNVGQFAQSVLKGAGIYVDSWSHGEVIVRYNRVYDNMFAGIMLELTSRSWVIGNVVYRNGRGGDIIGRNNGTVGISINRLSHQNRIFHNTVYNNVGTQISIHGPLSLMQFSNGNRVRNNIAVPGELGTVALRVFGPDPSDFGANVIRHNNFGPERPGFIEWGSQMTVRGPRTAPLDSYVQFEDQYAADTSFGGSTNSVNAEPEFVDASTGNFKLKTGSLLVGAGDSGALIEEDIDGLPFGNPPTIGAHAATE